MSPAVTPTKKVPGVDDQQPGLLLTRQKLALEDKKSESTLSSLNCDAHVTI